MSDRLETCRQSTGGAPEYDADVQEEFQIRWLIE